MTLLELLVRELPKRGGWPDGAIKIHQDHDREAWAWFSDGYSNIKSLGKLNLLCENNRPYGGDETSEMFVTVEQYENSLSS